MAHQGTPPLAVLLRERVGPQLGALGMAYSRCVLCFEGSAAFELALLSCVEELVALGRRAGIALALLTSTSEAQTQVELLFLGSNLAPALCKEVLCKGCVSRCCTADTRSMCAGGHCLSRACRSSRRKHQPW